MEIGSNKKVGLLVGIISDGLVSARWHLHMKDLGKKLPGGLYWEEHIVVANFKKDPTKNYATSRTEIVEKALAKNYKWLMFIDSDIFIPEDAITRLMSHGKDIVTGVYWMKTNPPQPVVFEEIGDGPIWNIEPKDELQEIGGAGLGCTLINLDVFRKFKEKGIPFFDQDWVYENPTTKRRIQIAIGEDHWFFHNARELGYKVWMDTNVLCDHYDANTDTMYPNQEFVRKLVAKKLKKNGYGEIVDHQTMVRNIEKDKPTIVFFNASTVKFNGSSIEQKPVSGSETAMIQMAKNMKKKDWNVHVFCSCDAEGYYDNVGYHDCTKINTGMKAIMDEIGKEIDVFVSSRDVRPFVNGRPGVGKTVLWCHDMPSEMLKDLPKAIENIDYIFFVSEFQAKEYVKYFKGAIPEEKVVITRNGINPDLFKTSIQKKKGVCVYTTTPFRGLDVLVNAWPKIKAQVPHAELHIYSDMSIYNVNNDDATNKLFEHIRNISADNSMFLFKPIKQADLAAVIQQADLMLYPCHYPETSCITAMEAEMARTPLITNNFGALKETVHWRNGVFVSDGDSKQEGFEEKFIQETVKMLTDKAHRNSFCLETRDLSWEKVSDNWDKFFKERLFNIKHEDVIIEKALENSQ